MVNPRTRKLAFGLAGVVVVAGVAVGLTLGTGSGDSRGNAASGHTSAPHSSQTTSASPTSPARNGPSNAQQAVSGYVKLNNTALHHAKVDPAELDRVAQGYAKGELRAQAEEFDERGWRQEGSAKVVGQHTVRKNLHANPPTVVVQVCVDSSGLRVLGPDGKPAPGWQEKPKRVPNRYTMVREHGSWKVRGHGYPKAATC